MNAYDAITINSLFWIVSNDDKVATILIRKIEGKATFVPMNKIKEFVCSNKQSDDKLIKLSDRINEIKSIKIYLILYVKIIMLLLT